MKNCYLKEIDKIYTIFFMIQLIRLVNLYRRMFCSRDWNWKIFVLIILQFSHFLYFSLICLHNFFLRLFLMIKGSIFKLMKGFKVNYQHLSLRKDQIFLRKILIKTTIWPLMVYSTTEKSFLTYQMSVWVMKLCHQWLKSDFLTS